MMRALIIILAVILWALPVGADHKSFPMEKWMMEYFCAEGENLDHWLRTEKKQAPVASGPAANGSIMRVYRNKDGSKWSVMLVYPKGRSCWVFVGDNLEDIPWILGKGKGI